MGRVLRLLMASAVLALAAGPGEFRFLSLPVGSYEIVASASGFQTASPTPGVSRTVLGNTERFAGRCEGPKVRGCEGAKVRGCEGCDELEEG
jgi:hypothetical protein